MFECLLHELYVARILNRPRYSGHGGAVERMGVTGETSDQVSQRFELVDMRWCFFKCAHDVYELLW